ERLELNRSDLESGVDAEVVGGNRRSDEAGGGRLKDDRPHVHSPDNLVLQSLVVHPDIVIGGEIAVVLIVQVEVHAPPNDAGGAQVHMVIESRRLEATPAA